MKTEDFDSGTIKVDCKEIGENSSTSCEGEQFRKWTEYSRYNESNRYNYTDGCFQCQSGKIIPRGLHCNGDYDCDDRSDEGEEHGCRNKEKGKIYIH